CASHRLQTGGAVRRPIRGASNTGAGSVHKQARRWSAGIATLDAGAYAHSARTDPPAAFLGANARPAADVRPAPGDPALNFCPSTTVQHGLGPRLGTWSWRANILSIAGVFGGALVLLRGIVEGHRIRVIAFQI